MNTRSVRIHRRHVPRNAARLLASLAGIALAPLASAGGFSIQAQGTQALGSAFSGVASLDDASTVWFNPASMGGLDKGSLVAAASLIDTGFSFHNGGSTGAYALPTSFDDDGGGFHVVPQLYAAIPMDDRLRLGFAANLPFGLATEYDAGWRGQFVALKSQARAINLNPAVAWRIGERTWIGGGVNWQRFSAQLSNYAGPAAGTVVLKAHDASWGFNLGAWTELANGAKLGLSYRSRISYALNGDVRFSLASALNGGANASLSTPESASVNVAVPVTPAFELMANVVWTKWSRLDELRIVRTTATPLTPVGAVLNVLPFEWRNSWLAALGAAWRPSGSWELRFGVASDPRVAEDVHRTPRLPDQSRILITAGAGYRWGNSAVDAAYGHEFVKDARVGNTVAGVPGALVGTFRNRADVLSLQYSLRF